MPKIIIYLFSLLLIISCQNKVQKIKPFTSSISESIYASGIIKSENQYQAFPTVNGIIESVLVSEGDSVKQGQAILTILNEAQKLSNQNAALTAAFSDMNANQDKLNEAILLMDISKSKMKSDSVMLIRQKNLWAQHIGTKVDLEQRELAFQNSKTSYRSSIIKYTDLKRQLDFKAKQSQNNLLISNQLTSDYVLRSEIDGVVFGIFKTKGDLVSTQTPLAVIGDAKKFILEMQVDEYDILKIKTGLLVLVTLDSYKGKVFEAKVSKINPLMNERSKTFLVEGEFIKAPELLYPNISFEANILLQSKERALLIPRNYLINDSMVLNSKGDSIRVKTGLKDYQMVEIVSGITTETELITLGK